MTSDAPISVRGLTKRYGDVTAVDDLSFEARAGAVTGFLGPNGAGKTTTLRVLLGLVNSTEGSATILGRGYDELDDPMKVVGSQLTADGFHPWRSARSHLRFIAAAAGIAPPRVDEVLHSVELTHAARRRVGGYSLGMRQRLGLAAALLGSPRILVLDEPANGLDPGGIRWLRDFLRGFAADGKTVLVSSHLLSEVAQTVDDVVVIANGRKRAEGPLSSLLAGAGETVLVRTPYASHLRACLVATGIRADVSGIDELIVTGVSADTVDEVATHVGIPLSGMRTQPADLEAAFFELTTPPTSEETP